jgi:hypothetical protein
MVDLCAIVQGCNAIALSSWPYTLEVRQGGTLIGSAVSGCVSVPWNGTYDLTVISSRFGNGTATVTVTGGVYTTPTINLSPATGYVCCATYAVPIADTLYLTDSTGTVALTWNGTSWAGGNTVNFTGTMTDWFTGGVCGTCSNPASGTVGVLYNIACTGAGNLIQQWGESTCTLGGGGAFHPSQSTYNAGTGLVQTSWSGCPGIFPGSGNSRSGNLGFSVLPLNATVSLLSPITGASVVVTE